MKTTTNTEFKRPETAKTARSGRADEWPTLSLREAGISLIDCEHRTPPASESGYPYIAIPQLRNGRIDLTKVRRITLEHFVEWTRKARPEPYDVVLSRRCNPGETAFVPPGFECAIGQNLVLLRANGERVFKPFLRWLVRGTQWWEQVGRFINVGAVFNSLKCADIPNFALCIPPLAEQRLAANILGILDNKIELNQEMSKTLEKVAETVFKHWFIDFEFPNDEGDPYKSFGGEMIYSQELGERIPKGWSFSRLGQLARVELGGTPDRTRKEFWNGNINWINSGKVNEFRIVEPSEQITREGLENSATKLLPKGTVVLAITGATLGQVSRLEIDSCANQSVIGIVADEKLPSEYLYFWTRNTIGDITSWQTGGAQQHINKGNVENSIVLVPSERITQEYTGIVRPIFEKISSLCVESLSLERIRDLLLPKLMSGKVRVPAEVR